MVVEGAGVQGVSGAEVETRQVVAAPRLVSLEAGRRAVLVQPVAAEVTREPDGVLAAGWRARVATPPAPVSARVAVEEWLAHLLQATACSRPISISQQLNNVANGIL